MCLMFECLSCGFYDSDFGCSCSSLDSWYACPIESAKSENQKALEDYANWVEEQHTNEQKN